MRTFFKTMAVAALVAMPAISSAQGPTAGPFQLSVTGHPFKTTGTGYPGGGTGGGFEATFTADLGNGIETFTDYLVWCIDPDRTVTVPGGPYSYSAYTVADYAANPAVGPANGYAITVDDLDAIASIAFDLETNWAAYNGAQRSSRQGEIWGRYRGENLVAGNEDFDTFNWFVLHGNDGNQTFITRIPEGVSVPEPSSLALLAFGAGSMLIAVRRKRQV